MKQILLIVAAAAGLALTGSAFTSERPLARETSCARTPIEVELSLSSAPALGETFFANVRVTSHEIAPGTQVTVELPDGIQPVAGALTQTVDLRADTPVELAVALMAAKMGNFTIVARALAVADQEALWGDMARAYFHVGQTAGTLGHVVTPLALARGVQPAPGNQVAFGDPILDTTPFDLVLPTPPAAQPGYLTKPPAPSTRGTVTVTGSLSYYDKNGAYRGNGYILAELLTTSSSHLAFTYLDGNGGFTFPPVSNPGQFYVKFYAYTKWIDDNNEVYVRPLSGSNTWSNTHAVWTSTLNATEPTTNIGNWYVTPGDSREGAYWVQGYENGAWLYCYWNGSTTKLPGHTVVEWEETSTTGTYYSQGGNVHLKGEDKQSEDTCVHEMGHSIQYNIYNNYLPSTPNCSPHYINGTSSQGCAWVEGFADFLVMPVNGDTRYTWPSGSWIDMESPTWGTFNWSDGDSVEGRVAGALYDILDSNNEGYDKASMGFNEIWQVLHDQTDSSLYYFWSAWKSYGHPKHQPVQSIYQNTIDYNTPPTIAGVPDVTISENRSYENVLYFGSYAADAESADSELSFSIIGNSNSNVGASIDANGYLDIHPRAFWWGSSVITVRVSDGIDTASDVFVITVNPQPDIHLALPANGATLASPPTFVASYGDPLNVVFAIDFGPSAGGPWWDTLLHGGITMVGPSWKMTNALWNAIPHGVPIYWRLIGYHNGYIQYSEETFTFIRQ